MLHRRKEIVATVSILMLWEMCSHLMKREFLPCAVASVRELFKLIADGTLIQHFLTSFYRIGIGTVAGMLIAVPVGLIIGQSQRLNNYFGTILNILYPVPKVVFLPIIVVAMGIGDLPKIFLIAVVLFFQVTVIVRDASVNIPAELSRSMHALGANNMQYMYHLVFLGCLPDIMTALKGTIGVSMAMLFITENFASTSGLGYYVSRCMDSRDYEKMYAGILLMIALGLFLYGLVEMTEKKVCKWKILENNTKTQEEM